MALNVHLPYAMLGAQGNCKLKSNRFFLIIRGYQISDLQLLSHEHKERFEQFPLIQSVCVVKIRDIYPVVIMVN